MSIFRYNFNAIQNRDLKKYLHSKLDFEKWEESIAEEATLAHYRHFRKISYGFPMVKNNFIIMKKLLKKVLHEYELPFLCFDKKNEKEILNKNIDFIETGIYYLRNGEGKKELFNYNLTSINAVDKLIVDRYKDVNDDVQFILEKSNKKLLLFQGNSFELRTYVLIVQIDKKIYTFLYPLLIAHFGIENINMAEFLNFLDIGYENSTNISSYHPLLNNIYQIVKKTATVIANICKLSNYIYKLENDNKNKNSKKLKMQYNLYALDIIFNDEKQPFLIDIISNPVYQASKEESKTIREKNKMYDDILENFVNNFAKFDRINYDNTKFILLSDATQYFEYKLLISKKINDEFLENNDILSKDGEKFLIKCLNDDTTELTTDNLTFFKGNLSEKEKKKVVDECIFEDKKDEIVEKKIDILLQKERKERKEKIVRIIGATVPIFLATYLARKTYLSYTKKDKN